MIKRVGLGLVLITFFILIWVFDLLSYFDLALIKAHSDQMRTFVQQHYLQSVLFFILSYIVVGVLFLPLATFMGIVGGFLFGILPGAVYTTVGATAAAVSAFLLVRYMFRDWLSNKYKKQFERFNAALQVWQQGYLIVIHFFVVIPFALINILAGLSRISVWTFIWTNLVGIFPAALIYAFAGKQLANVESTHDLFSTNIIVALVLLACMGIAPLLCMRFLRIKQIM